MANPKIYPVVVDDFIPFCIFVVANSKRDVKKIISKTYSWVKDCISIDYLPPLNIKEGTIFALDVEMSIIKDSEELFKWICSDEDGYYADGFSTKPGEIIEVEIGETAEDTDSDSEESKENDDESSSKSEPAKTKYIWL